MLMRGTAPRRILVISDHYPPHLQGGYCVACESITEGLRRRGHQIRVLTSTFGVGRRQTGDYIDRVLHRPQDSASITELGWWELQDHRALRAAIASWRPDLISVWRLFQLFPSLHRSLAASGVPVVYNLHDLWLPGHCDHSAELALVWEREATGWIRKSIKQSVRQVLRSVDPDATRSVALDDIRLDHSIFCSRYRHAQHEAAGLAGSNPGVIHNGIDLERFRAPVRRRENSRLRLLFVGRLVEEKGPHTVVEALALLAEGGCQDIVLTVVGIRSFPHEYVQGIEHQIETHHLGDRITILPAVTNAEMPDLYRQHDALVFPSIGPEGFPMVLLEAAASGLALVGTSTGGTGEFLEDGVTGLVFAPGDSAQLAAHLDTLLRHPERAMELAEGAQRRVESEFDIERIIDLTEAFLGTVVT